MAYLYIEIADKIRKEITEGNYAADTLLPTEYQLMEKYGISRQTVRNALSVLKGEGVLYQIHGSGTYVKKQIQEEMPEDSLQVKTDDLVPVRPAGRNRKTIGVLCTYISNYIFPSIIRGIERRLSAAEADLRLASTENRVDLERQLLLRFLDEPVDGLIVEGTKTTLPSPNIDLYMKLKEMGTKLVFIHSCYPELSDEVLVGMDDTAGGRMAVNELIQEGCRSLAGVFKNDDIQGIRRYAGFTEGVRDGGLLFDDRKIKWFNTEESAAGIWKDADALGSFLDKVTGVVCYNDSAAIDLTESMRRFGISRKLGIVSFDRSPYSSFMSGMICLVHPQEKLGMTAAEKILSLIEGNEEASEIMQWTVDRIE